MVVVIAPCAVRAERYRVPSDDCHKGYRVRAEPPGDCQIAGAARGGTRTTARRNGVYAALSNKHAACAAADGAAGVRAGRRVRPDHVHPRSTIAQGARSPDRVERTPRAIKQYINEQRSRPFLLWVGSARSGSRRASKVGGSSIERVVERQAQARMMVNLGRAFARRSLFNRALSRLWPAHVAICESARVETPGARKSSVDDRQRLRLNKNTACSPNRFQNHHGALRRNGEPQALSATARSIFAPTSRHSSRKSLMVQK